MKAPSTRIVGAVVARDPGIHLGCCLDSLAWTDARIVILDSRTRDRSADVAAERGAKVFIREFKTFPEQRNAALDLIRSGDLGEWVIFLDHDERASTQLAVEARAAIASFSPDSPVGYWIPRRDFIWGSWIRHGGWWPDHQLRLLKVSWCRYDEERDVHELVKLDGVAGNLQETMIHYNYDTLGQFLQKQQQYSRLEERRLRRAGVHPQPWSFVLQPYREFRRRFVELRGYRDGWRGLALAILLGWYVGKTYARLITSPRGPD